jgi:hypothetical protein
MCVCVYVCMCICMCMCVPSTTVSPSLLRQTLRRAGSMPQCLVSKQKEGHRAELHIRMHASPPPDRIPWGQEKRLLMEPLWACTLWVQFTST